MRVPKLSAKDLSDCGILAFNRHGKDRLRTKVELIPALAGLEDSPWGEWTGLDGTAGPHMQTQGDIGRLYAPSPSDRRRSGRRDDARERNQRADIPVSNSRRHGPPIANQAPHRHRQAKSGTCRGREPPHARHTFEVLPPETRPNKIDLSRRKSWCESDDPAFAAKAADIVRLYMAWPRARLHGGDDLVLGRRRHLVSSSKSKRGPPGRGVVTMPRKGFGEFAHRGRFYRARSR